MQALASTSLLRPTRCARSLHSLAPSRSLLTRRGLQKPQFARRWYSADQSSGSGSSGQRDRAAVGVFTPKAALLFVATGAGLYWYFKHEKEKMLEERQKTLADRAYGRPSVGGPFELTTHDGKTFTHEDMKGKWTLVYFGFTNCPDICPAELDKMTTIVNEAETIVGPSSLQPIFITVDPARDSPSQMARYLQDFHPSFIGLFGSYDATKSVCKAYRVYFSTPPNTKPGDDYLVDHSIFVYLMDPEGDFVEAFGQTSTVGEVLERLKREVEAWKAGRRS